MEQMINVAGKQYIIPSEKISSLVAWCESNAVRPPQKEVVREVTGDKEDPRQLLTEQHNG